MRVCITVESNSTPIKRPIRKKELAGVGRPVKYLVSGLILKMANLKAPPIKTKKDGTYMVQCSNGLMNVYKYAGATPNETMSANESNSLPMSL